MLTLILSDSFINVCQLFPINKSITYQNTKKTLFL